MIKLVLPSTHLINHQQIEAKTNLSKVLSPCTHLRVNSHGIVANYFLNWSSVSILQEQLNLLQRNFKMLKLCLPTLLVLSRLKIGFRVLNRKFLATKNYTGKLIMNYFSLMSTAQVSKSLHKQLFPKWVIYLFQKNQYF